MLNREEKKTFWMADWLVWKCLGTYIHIFWNGLMPQCVHCSSMVKMNA